MRIVRELGYKSTPIKEKTSFLGITVARTTVGFRYSGKWVALFCHGPIDSLNDIIIDGQYYASRMAQQPELSWDGWKPVYNFYAPVQGVGLPSQYGLPHPVGGAFDQWDGTQDFTLRMSNLFGSAEMDGGGIS